jgi:hypothetical protein
MPRYRNEVPGELKLRVLEVREDSRSLYTHVEVSLQGEAREIRWGLDKPTFSGLRGAAQMRPPEAMPGMRLDYFIVHAATPGPDRLGTGVLLCCGERISAEFEFQCSYFFQTNLNWMRQVKSMSEFDHLDWTKQKHDV